MWSAFKNLCNIGEFVEPASVFQCPDGLNLITPTYAVVLDNLHSGLDETDTAARENVNPQLSESAPNQAMLSSNHYESTAQEAYHIDVEHLRNIQRSFVSFCSKSLMDDLGPSVKSVDVITPDVIIPSALSPKAPKAIDRLTRRFTQHTNSQALDANGIPRFGVLSFFPQSPMFACVPVFSRLSGNQSASPESILSNSIRLAANHQCLPVWQLALSQIDDGQNDISCFQIPRQRNRTLSSNSTTAGVKKDHHSNESESNQNITDTAKALNASEKPDTHSGTGRQSVASPASALRHLVSTTTPNLESSVNLSTNPLVNTPSSRLEPPLLRSAAQHSVYPSPNIRHIRDSPLVLRSNLQYFNPASQSPGMLTSSSTPRPLSSQQTSTGCRAVENTIPTDLATSGGPRTRSQVAAAAAVARASGIQRRSNRFLRSRGHNRKLDSKLLPSESMENSVSLQPKVNCPNSCPTSNSPKTMHSSVIEDVPAFGYSNHYKVPLSVEAAYEKDDPRTQSLQQYLSLLSQLGKAYQMLVRHQWRSATRLLLKLPSSQLHTGRVLAWAARAHMDNADYQTAHKLFNEARRLEPWQLCGMDFYSTVLWQIQADQELSQLAHDLLELDRNAPEPWCVAGNCFSLQGEHETAIKFFRRALQISPTSVYAWTLLGHEQSTLEEFDRALAAFQYALRIDPRHYNALFGISNVYYKQEKFDLSEIYLIRAVALFPQSHLLLTNLAALRSRLGRLDDGYGSAMDLINRACKIQSNNPLARYHKASILYILDVIQKFYQNFKSCLF
ncbi:unnamed protein product [Heterobilharzia americana]|nr:unnamed protein product [Heterobilharzia americana]